MKKYLTMLLFLMVVSNLSSASSYDQSNWYLSFDVKQIKTTIMPLIPEQQVGKNDFSFENHIPDEVSGLTVYGHSEVEDDLSIILTGEFSSFALNDYFFNLIDQFEGELPITLAQSKQYQGVSVNYYAVTEKYVGTDNQDQLVFYSAKLSNSNIIVSREEQEVKNWIDNKYNINDLYQSDLVSLLINIESAMAHMGADLSDNSKAFDSAVFQKIKQVSASAYQTANGEDLAIEAALTTADEATAAQLEQVLNSLIAMNGLSEMDQENPLLAALLSGLQISNQGNDLLISTEFALKMIAEMDID